MQQPEEQQITYRMARRYPREHTCIAYSQSLDAEHPHFRIHNTTHFALIIARGHPATRRRVIYRLDTLLDELLNLGVGLGVHEVVKVRAGERGIQVICQGFRLGDLEQQSNTANELLQVFRSS